MGRTPYELVYGRKCRTWLSLRLRGNDKPEGPIGEFTGLFGDDLDDCMEERFAEMSKLRQEMNEHAEARQQKANLKNKKSYDKRHRIIENGITKGCYVWKTDNQVSRKTSTGKLLPKWAGPFKVLKITSTTAHLEGANGKVIKGVRFELLKKRE